MAGRGRQGVDYMKPKEPSFLSKFKRDMGYREGPSINSKKANLPVSDEDDRPDADDEQPLVVILKEGDLSREEYEEHKNNRTEEDPGGSTSPSGSLGKLSFKKPSKRANQDSPGVQFGSSKKKKNKEKNRQGSKSKKIQNQSLLSFAEDEEEQE